MSVIVTRYVLMFVTDASTDCSRSIKWSSKILRNIFDSPLWLLRTSPRKWRNRVRLAPLYKKPFQTTALQTHIPSLLALGVAEANTHLDLTHGKYFALALSNGSRNRAEGRQSDKDRQREHSAGKKTTQSKPMEQLRSKMKYNFIN